MAERYQLAYQAVIFDFDDTLVATLAAKWAQHREVAKAYYGVDIPETELRAHWGKPFDALISLLYKNADSVENMRAANRSLDEWYPKRELPGARKTLGWILEHGVAVGILSSDNTYYIIRDLVRLRFPVNRIFHIQGADDTKRHKPDPEVFAAIISKLTANDIGLSEILYVGDSMSDCYAARDAGIGFVGVTTGLVDSAAFKALGFGAVSSIAELPEWLRRESLARSGVSGA
jgi:phosphoglycolate phosphatase-like HAD superfamily hydrolase